jgi:hypothetical protein
VAELADRPVEVLVPERHRRHEAAAGVGDAVAHPAVDGLERVHAERGVVDRAGERIARPADHVLHVDALLVEPPDPVGQRGAHQLLVLIGPRVPGLGTAVGVVLRPHAVGDEPLDRHPP